MIRLPAGDVPKVLPIIRMSSVRSHLSLVHSVIEGRQNGAIFVDDVTEPKTVLVVPVSGFCFLFGKRTTVASSASCPRCCAIICHDRPWSSRLQPHGVPGSMPS